MVDEKQVRADVATAVQAARDKNPMAGSVTNFVTIEFVANAQLAVGGSAAMVYMPDEGEFIAEAGPALYLNVGTLLPIHEQTIPRAAARAHELGRPWVLDPVAVGMGEERTKILEAVRPSKPSIIRANASEVIALAGLWGLADAANNVRGVDSTDEVDAALPAAVALARYTGGAVAVSGEVDLVTDGHIVARSHGGSRFMGMVTGCGCSLGGVIAVYAAVAEPFAAALAGTAIYNLAGARAEASCKGPGSFQRDFIDDLFLASPEDVAANELELSEL